MHAKHMLGVFLHKKSPNVWLGGGGYIRISLVNHHN